MLKKDAFNGETMAEPVRASAAQNGARLPDQDLYCKKKLKTIKNNPSSIEQNPALQNLQRRNLYPLRPHKKNKFPRVIT